MVEFYMGNYADYIDRPITQLGGHDKSVWLWRGYTFKVSTPTTVTALIGGMRLNTTEYVGHVALYKADTETFWLHRLNETPVPTELLATASMSNAGYKQVMNINPVLLEVGQLYLIAQGAGGAWDPENLVRGLCMGAVEWYDDDVNYQIMADHSFTLFNPHANWEEEDRDPSDQLYKAYIWAAVHGYNPEDILGERAADEIGAMWGNAANARPPIGFVYDAWNIWVKKSGAWQPVTDIWAYKSGAWQPVSSVDVNKDGWKPI